MEDAEQRQANVRENEHGQQFNVGDNIGEGFGGIQEQWRVVHKARRQRKNKEDRGGTGRPKNRGSRFRILADVVEEDNGDHNRNTVQNVALQMVVPQRTLPEQQMSERALSERIQEGVKMTDVSQKVGRLEVQNREQNIGAGNTSVQKKE